MPAAFAFAAVATDPIGGARLVVVGLTADGHAARTDRVEALGPDSVDRWALTRRWASGTVDRRPEAQTEVSALYLQGGRLWRLLLQGDPAAQRATAIGHHADLCRLAEVHEIDLADGVDAWLEVERAGVDGRCETPLDNAAGWLRLADGQLVPMPEGHTTVAALRRADGRLAFLLSHDAVAGRLLLRRAESLDAVLAVEDGEGITAAASLTSPFVDAQGGGSVDLDVNGGHLRRLSWTADGARLGVERHRFNHAGPRPAVRDGRSLYFADGSGLWRLDGADTAAALHAALPADDGEILRLSWADEHLLVTQGFARPVLWTVHKSNGLWRVRLGGGAGDAAHHAFIGHRSGRVTHSATEDVGGAGAGRATMRLYRTPLGLTPGQPDLTGVALAGVVSAPGAWPGDEPTQAVLVCRPPMPGPTADCRGSPLQQFDLVTGAVLDLGRWPDHPTLSGFRVTARASSLGPALLSVRGTRHAAGTAEAWVDLWSFTPGVTGSLRPVTELMP